MILLVDDDPKFLAQAEAMLAHREGLYFARDAKHALELMATVGASFSVALVDLDLPGVNGLELMDKLRRHFPDLPVIAISGVFGGHALEVAKEFGAVEVLSKPATVAWNAAIDRARGRAKAEGR